MLDVRVPDAPRSFAEALRHAVDRRQLSLDRIHCRLDERGVSVSVATLSYWQSGRSEPSRKSSLAAIPHLEEVLQLGPGELMRALPATRERPRRNAVQGLDALWPEPSQTAVLSRLDTSWDAELDRVTLHDLLRIGPDRRQTSLSVRQAMRARCDGPDRRVVMHSHDDPDAGAPHFRAVRGCTLGRVEQNEEGSVVGAELVFFAPLRRGETVIVEYEVVAPEPGPSDNEYTRRLRMPMREYLLEVEFHPASLPRSVVAITDGRKVELRLDVAHRAHLVHTDPTAGATGIRWTWPDRHHVLS